MKKFTDFHCDCLPSGETEIKAFTEFLIQENRRVKEVNKKWKLDLSPLFIKVRSILPSKEFNQFLNRGTK